MQVDARLRAGLMRDPVSDRSGLVLARRGAEFTNDAAPMLQNGQRQLEHVDVEQFGRLSQRRAAHHTLTAAVYVETLVHSGYSLARGRQVERDHCRTALRSWSRACPMATRFTAPVEQTAGELHSPHAGFRPLGE